jgi:hypothetical protein
MGPRRFAEIWLLSLFSREVCLCGPAHVQDTTNDDILPDDA